MSSNSPAVLFQCSPFLELVYVRGVRWFNNKNCFVVQMGDVNEGLDNAEIFALNFKGFRSIFLFVIVSW